MIYKIKKSIRQKDKLAPKAINLFHYGNDFLAKTTFGGILTIAIDIIVMLTVFSQLYKMLWYIDPYIGKIEKDLQFSDEFVYLNQTTTLAMSFQDYTFKSYDIDRSKLHLYIERFTSTFTDGKKSLTRVRGEIKKCLKEDLKTNFEKKTYDFYNFKDMYCLDK